MIAYSTDIIFSVILLSVVRNIFTNHGVILVTYHA